VNELVTSVALGFVQGAAEFLPVSSSGHLALLIPLTRRDESQVLPLITLLHFATLLSAVVYFRREIGAMLASLVRPGGREGREGRRMLLHVLAGTAVTGAVGLSLKGVFERLFTAPSYSIAGLALTGVLLLLADRRVARWYSPRPLTLPVALLIGLAQGAAIAPGLSRSGTTIAVGLLCGLSRPEAFTFSFLVSLPAIAGATLLEARGLAGQTPHGILVIGSGMAVAFVTGLAALAWLSDVVRNRHLTPFAYYVWFVALIALVASSV
jgi:undecaprenyl-diphosphatase